MNPTVLLLLYIVLYLQRYDGLKIKKSACKFDFYRNKTSGPMKAKGAQKG